jgi:hypothetical protein
MKQRYPLKYVKASDKLMILFLIEERRTGRKTVSVIHYDFYLRLVAKEKFSCVSFKKFCSLICNCPFAPFASLLPNPFPVSAVTFQEPHMSWLCSEPAVVIRALSLSTRMLCNAIAECSVDKNVEVYCLIKLIDHNVTKQRFYLKSFEVINGQKDPSKVLLSHVGSVQKVGLGGQRRKRIGDYRWHRQPSQWRSVLWNFISLCVCVCGRANTNSSST